MEQHKLALLFHDRHYREKYVPREELQKLLRQDKPFNELVIRELKKDINLSKIADQEVKSSLISKPDHILSDKLVIAGVDSGLFQKDESGCIHFTLHCEDSRLESRFFEPYYERRSPYPTRNQLITLMRTSTIFYEYLLWEILEKMVARINSDPEYHRQVSEKLERREFPTDIHKEISDFVS